MAGVLQHLRSSTLDKRPNPASMVDGQVAINYASGAPGMFFKDSNGSLVKVGPVHVGSGAPNASPASGGTAGNSLGEQWLDTSGGTYVFKVWDGSAWRSEAGEFVNVTGDTMTGALGIIAGSASTPGLFFSGDANSGLYSPGADQVAISTNGTGRLFVDASGNVGLATSSPISVGVTGMPAVTLASATSGRSGALYWADTGLNNKASSYWFGSVFNFGTETNHPVVFTQNASEKMRLTATGLGLGSSNPLATNHIRGSGTSGQVTASWLLENASSGTVGMDVTGAPGSSIWRFLYGGGPSTGTNALTPAITIGVEGSAAGRVGIGDNAPSHKLVVRQNNSGGVAAIHLPEDESTILGSTANTNIKMGGNMTVSAGGVLGFNTNGSERARIDSSGRLLVGTSSNTLSNARVVIRGNPAASGVDGTIQLSRDSLPSASTSGIGAIYFTDNSSNLGASIEGIADGSWTSGSNHRSRLVFSTTADGASSPTERARITSSGKTVINSTDPVLSATFSVLSQTGVNTCALRSDASTSAAILNIWGNETSGDQIFSRFATDLNAPRGSITYNRGGGVVAYNTTSDYRSKTILGDLENAGATIDAFKVYRGVMNGATVERPMLIAHEAQEVAPYCVTGEKDAVDDDGNPIYQQMDRQVLVPLLIAEIQQLRARVAALEAA